MLFREDLQYRMRRSCICTPSEDETSDPFEHVSHPWLLFAFPYDSTPFKSFGFLPVMQQSLHYGLTPHLRSTNLVHPPSQVWAFWSIIAAHCNHNTPKPSVPIATDNTAHYMELWSCSLIVSNPPYGKMSVSLPTSYFSFKFSFCLLYNQSQAIVIDLYKQEPFVAIHPFVVHVYIRCTGG